MAKKTQILLVDDIDGTPAAETISFALDGTAYEIELTTENAGRFRAALRPYIEAGRRRTPTTTTSRTALPATGETRRRELSALREWARANGHTVNDRGRIPREIEQAWRAATGK